MKKNEKPKQVDDWQEIPIDDWQEVSLNPEPSVSGGESALRGAAQGALMGFPDEATGLAGAVKQTVFGDKKLSEFPEVYRQERDESRANYEKAKSANPGLYTGGEIAGSIGSAFVPGFGPAKGAKFLSQLGRAAATGGIQAAGLSSADLTKGEVGKLGGDIATGAATGAVMQTALTGAGKALKGLTPKEIAKKTSRVMLGAPEEALDQYIKDPSAIKNAESVSELATRLQVAADTLKRDSIEGSQTARSLLSQSGKTIKGQTIADIFKNTADDITKGFEGVEDDVAKVKVRDYLLSKVEKYKDEITKPIRNEKGQIVQVAKRVEKDLSANRIKDLVQDISNRANYETAPGQFNSFGDRISKEVRAKVDALLKDDPYYAGMMKSVAKDTDLVNRLAPQVKDSDKAKNLIRAIGRGRKEESADLIAEVDKRLGTDFVQAMRNSLAKEAFDKTATNGSRNVNLYKSLGEMGKDTNIWLGKQVGSLIGATVDKYGPAIAQKAVDMAVAIHKIGNSHYLEGAKTAMQKISDFAKKGDPAAVLTFQLLDSRGMGLVTQPKKPRQGLQLPGSR